MSLRTSNVKWWLAFAAAVVVGAAGVVLVLTLMDGGGDEQAAAQPAATPTSMPLATHPPAPTGTLDATVTPDTVEPAVQTYPVNVPTLSPDFTVPEKRPCPEGWRRLSDNRANYSFCLPPGWAILDASSSEPSTRTTLEQYESAAILSPEAFPYPYAGSLGEGIRDLMRDSENNIIWMQMLPHWTAQQDSISMTCQAEPLGMAGALPSARCQNHFDIPPGTDLAVPDLEGKWQRLFVVVPLPEAQTPTALETLPYPTPEGATPSLLASSSRVGTKHWSITGM